MKQRFSATNREMILEHMAAEPLELLVIGGGITGAGIAWDASSRGLRTGLIEMGDFAWGTSSRSTKLVHGGLRYLKQGEVNLVKEVGRERALLHDKAPHIVIPVPMMLPVFKGGTYGYAASSVGLYVYDWLAGVKRKERRKMYSPSQTLLLEPLLKRDQLKGSGYYYEYRTDDARLTVEIMKSATALGAQIVNYAKAESFIYRDGKVVGIKVQDRISGKMIDIYAQKIVNAAGPWVDEVRTMDRSKRGKHLLLTKGVHLVVDAEKLPVAQAAYFDVSDGRMIFVIPRGNKTYIGTTDTVYNGEIGKPRATRQDRDYLLRAVNDMFPSVGLTAADVDSSWAGLRPLIHEEGKSPSEISRKDEIFHAPSGLISIAGGKLTGFRKMAQKIVDLVCEELSHEEGRTIQPCRTHLEPISGGSYEGYSDYADFRDACIHEGMKRKIGETAAEYVVDVYGGNTWQVYAEFDRLDAAMDAEKRLIAAEVGYSVEHEMCASVTDFLVRRTGMLFFDRPRAEEWCPVVAACMGELLGWSEAERDKQIALMCEELEQAVSFPDESELRQGVEQAI